MTFRGRIQVSGFGCQVSGAWSLVAGLLSLVKTDKHACLTDSQEPVRIKFSRVTVSKEIFCCSLPVASYQMPETA